MIICYMLYAVENLIEKKKNFKTIRLGDVATCKVR